MKGEQIYVCHSLAEVKKCTNELCKAHEVPISINDGGVVKEVKNYKGIYNVTKGEFCAAVVPHYNLVSHKEYFDSFAEAMSRLGMKYTMTLKQSGNRAFADIEFQGRNLKFDKLGEEFTTGVRLINSYDKTTGLNVIPKFTRLACTNGMILSRSEKTLSIKHHSKILAEIGAFVETRLATIIQKDAELQTWVSDSMKDSIEWLSCCRILQNLFEQPKHLEEILKRLEIDLIYVKDKKSKKPMYSYLWKSEAKKKDKINRWQLYNAITNYLTFGEQITPHIEDQFHRKAEQILTTPFSKLKMAEALIPTK
jgi:hypothetical protein